MVITASDEDQRVAFETQIQNKLAKHQIPHGLPYLVYADPPGAKIGNWCIIILYTETEYIVILKIFFHWSHWEL